jgi:hypothetical protein
MSHTLFNLLLQLEAAKIHFILGRYRDDTITVSMTLVGERVEVDVFEDGHMEISRFVGNEDVVGGEELIKEIIAKNAE